MTNRAGWALSIAVGVVLLTVSLMVIGGLGDDTDPASTGASVTTSSTRPAGASEVTFSTSSTLFPQDDLVAEGGEGTGSGGATAAPRSQTARPPGQTQPTQAPATTTTTAPASPTSSTPTSSPGTTVPPTIPAWEDIPDNPFTEPRPEIPGGGTGGTGGFPGGGTAGFP